MASEPGSPEHISQNMLRVPHFNLEQALINDPNIQSGLLSKSNSYKCLSSVEPPDQVDGHTLSSVSLTSVGCPDPALLSNIFQESCPHNTHGTSCNCSHTSLSDTLLVPLQDAIDITTSYSVYNTQYSITNQHFVPELTSVAVSVPDLSRVTVSVPELSYQLQPDQETVTLTIPEPQVTAEDYRLQVLAKTWTGDLTEYLNMGLWADTDLYCAGGEKVSAHKLMLAAASPFLSSCLDQADAGDETICIIFPDFSLLDVKEFLDVVYLQWKENNLPSGQLLKFLTEINLENIIDKNESIKYEEKVKKLPVEVKMEENLEKGELLGLISAKNSSVDNEVDGTKTKTKGSHTCDKCGKTFKLNRILKEHMFLHSDPRFECDVEGCKRKFHLKANLKAHVDVVHLKIKNIPCDVCGKLFYNQTHLRSHMEHHNTDKHVCEHCSSYFSCSKSLRDHIKFKHTNPENLPTCSVCQKTFSTPQNLKSHFSRVHMQEKKYICSECGRSFFEKSELDFHLSSHNPKDLNVQCDVCKLMFKNSKTLYYHKKRTHDPNNKIHICYQCGKSYSDSHHLNRHMESHGQKSSYCKTCGKGFQSEQKVKAHFRKVHEKWRKSDEPEKPCVLCSKKFPNFGSMKRHLKDVHKLSVAEANTILVERFSLDPKKHRMNPSEILTDVLKDTG